MMTIEIKQANAKNNKKLFEPNKTSEKKLPIIAVVGNPNVGKSVLFNRLTGTYTVVSNYPGTTVEVFHGVCKIESNEYTIIDTPGMYSMIPITEEERSARDLLFSVKPNLVVHVVDGKNITRMLPLSLQIIECGFPLIIAVNMADELEKSGLEINIASLQEQLGAPAVLISGLTGEGIDKLKELIGVFCPSN